MAQQANLQAAIRSNTGKGAARSLRRQGKVPGVIYGHNRTPEALAIDTAALNKMLVGISAGTTVLDVVVDGRPAVKALIREIQRDSVRPAEILHLDLYEVRADEKVTLSVPVHLIGIPDGVRNFGGVLDHVAARAGDRGPAGRHPGACRAGRHQSDDRPFAVRPRHQDREGRDPQRARYPGVHRGGAAG